MHFPMGDGPVSAHHISAPVLKGRVREEYD